MREQIHATLKGVLAAGLRDTGIPVEWPGEQLDPPAPTGNRNAPAHYLVVQLEEVRPGTPPSGTNQLGRATFGGTLHWLFMVQHGLWQEQGTGDVTHLADTVATIWNEADLPPGYQPLVGWDFLGDLEEDGPYKGRLYEVPIFIRTTEGAPP